MDNKRNGEIRNNNRGTPMKIICYRHNTDIDVEFLDDFHYVKEHTTYTNFKRGQVKNPYDKTVHGVGCIGDGKYLTKEEDGYHPTREYTTWIHMIERYYHEKSSWQYPAYYGICTVCDEWKCFQTFAEWYKEREYDIDGRLHLDKDIKIPGNTVYSPETCILVPQVINALFINKQNKRGLPNGISIHKNGYVATFNHKSLGVFPTVEEAYYKQVEKKKEEIIKVANEYKEIIPREVYDAVISYEFKIENDRNYVV